VSTDSYEIARIARDYGAEVPFMRPAELADDQTGTDAVIVHAINCLKERNYSIRYVCCIYPTAPLMKAEFIRKGLELLVKHGAATAFSVTSFDYPIFRALKINESDRMEMFWPQYVETRSQDLPEAYHDAGQFYWADVKKYMQEKHFFSSDAVPVIIPQYLVQDIDTPEDWETAESMYLALQTRTKIMS
jgi:pseudaminic acid cytidylyltransferase